MIMMRMDVERLVFAIERGNQDKLFPGLSAASATGAPRQGVQDLLTSVGDVNPESATES